MNEKKLLKNKYFFSFFGTLRLMQVLDTYFNNQIILLLSTAALEK